MPREQVTLKGGISVDAEVLRWVVALEMASKGAVPLTLAEPKSGWAGGGERKVTAHVPLKKAVRKFLAEHMREVRRILLYVCPKWPA